MIGIYKITNPEFKVYIGQSKHLEIRFKDYKKSNFKSQIKIFESIEKYGIEFHKFEIIEVCETSNLNERERHWQEVFDSVDNGLNCQYVNTEHKKRKLSVDSIKRISESLKGKPAHNKGIPLTKDSIDKRTDKQANVYLDTDTFIYYSFKELIYLTNKKSTTLRRFLNKQKSIIKV